MINDPAFNSIQYNTEHLFSEHFSSQKSFLSNVDNTFHDSSINMNVNNDIVNDFDRYLSYTNDQYSDSSQSSTPLSPNTSQFRFILNALSSSTSSSKINEETTTYLNQGQPYEIKFHRNKIDTENLSITYRSILRLCFWDKTLQNQERELMQKWLNEYHFSSLFDIDMSLTYGILSIIRSKQIPNVVEIVWDTSTTTTSLFIRFKCTSTDFAQKRHGGEKGIPLRIQIDTYKNDVDDIQHLYACCCKIQLFRSKGAQRKHKADKMRIEKLNHDQRQQYQTTLEYTVLQPCFVSSLYTLNLLSLSYPPDDLYDISMTSIIEEKKSDGIENKDEDDIIGDLSSRGNLSLWQMKYKASEVGNFQSELEAKITIRSSNEEVLNWLKKNNFSSVVNRFQHYTGVDILRLTKPDLRQICNGDDAISIRLYNQLNETIIQPSKILYIKMTNNDIYSVIYLYTLTRYELREQLFQLIHQPQQELFNIILELNKIKIRIDNDNIVKYSLPNEGQFYLKIYPYEFNLCLLNTSV
jgi:transcription factor CP2-like protein